MYTRVSLIKKNNNKKKTAQLLTNTPSFFHITTENQKHVYCSRGIIRPVMAQLHVFFQIKIETILVLILILYFIWLLMETIFFS